MKWSTHPFGLINEQIAGKQWVFYNAVFGQSREAEVTTVSDHLTAAKFLGERLRELRRRHSLTQEQAATLCGMEYKYYQMIEWGRKNLRLDTIARLANAYGLNAWDLVQRDGIPQTHVLLVPKVVSAPHRPPSPRGRPPRKSPL